MVNQPGNKSNSEPKTSRYQIMASMTPEELLSEGYASYDDFYDPDEDEDEWRKELEEMEGTAKKEEELKEEDYVEF